MREATGMYDEDSSGRVRGVRGPWTGGEAPEPTLVATGRSDPSRDLRRVDRGGTRPRPACGPRPVRPAAVPVPVRPAQGERPVRRPEPGLRACPNRERLLVRPARAVPRSTAGPGRRLLGGLLVVLLAAAVVVGLGQLLVLAGPAAPAAAAVQAGTGSATEPTAAMVTVGAERTVWDLARRLEPAADGPRNAVLAERIVVVNHLTSVELRPGQVLRVPSD
jgi:hypothetical protein